MLIDDIDDQLRAELLLKVDPQIDSALEAKGYIEEHKAKGRIYLDGTHVAVSRLFARLYESSFNGMSLASEYAVGDGERTIRNAQLNLLRTGGITSSVFIKHGDKYGTKNLRAGIDSSTVPFTTLSAEQAESIVQDIRAHTGLGYSSSDVPVQVAKVIEEIEDQYSSLLVDQRASYQLMSSFMNSHPDYQHDVRMNVGKSFELQDIQIGNTVERQAMNITRSFEVIGKTPLRKGWLIEGIHYSSGHSGRDQPEMKISTLIEGEQFTNDEKQYFYDERVKDFQDENNFTKFGFIVLKHLASINDENSDIIRVA